MIEIKSFTETDFEFQEVTRLYNLVSHDDKEHIDDMKESQSIFLGKIDRFKQNFQGEGKSKLYRIAEPRLFNLFSDFTDEERKALLKKKIHQILIDMETSGWMEKERDEQNKSTLNSKPQKPMQYLHQVGGIILIWTNCFHQ